MLSSRNNNVADIHMCWRMSSVGFATEKVLSLQRVLSRVNFDVFIELNIIFHYGACCVICILFYFIYLSWKYRVYRGAIRNAGLMIVEALNAGQLSLIHRSGVLSEQDSEALLEVEGLRSRLDHHGSTMCKLLSPHTKYFIVFHL